MILIYKGRFEEAFEVGGQVFQEGKILNNSMNIIEAVFIKFAALFMLGRVLESKEDVNSLKSNSPFYLDYILMAF